MAYAGRPVSKLSMRMPQNYKRLEVLQGFRFQQELIFMFKSRNIADDRDTGLWVVLYT